MNIYNNMKIDNPFMFFAIIIIVAYFIVVCLDALIDKINKKK